MDDEHELPAFAAGGYVRETGLAVVHEGEYILPAPGSEATIDAVPHAGAAVVNYYFPVEIEIAGSLAEEDRAAIQSTIWSQLLDALQRQA